MNPVTPKPDRTKHRGSAPTRTARVDDEQLDLVEPKQKIEPEPRRKRDDFPLRYGR